MYSVLQHILYRCKLQLLGLTIRICATPDTKTTKKKHPLDVAKKYVEMCSLSNAAARDLEEMEQNQ